MSGAKKIHILFHDAGGGHRNAAVALKAVCEQQSRPWEINLVQFQDLTDHLDILRRLTGVRIQEQYNILLRNGWTWGSEYLLRILQLTISIFHKSLVKLLANYWREHPADLLISVIPHFNRQIAESWNSVYPEHPFVTIITDMADFPPRFWIEPIAEQIVIAGSERAEEQARNFGKTEKNLFRASGMILRPEFYAEQQETPLAIRKGLGLDEALPTAIVLFGGYGSNVMYDIVEQLLHARSQPPDARRRFSDRQTRSRNHCGSNDFRPACFGGMQFEHATAGAFQHRMGDRKAGGNRHQRIRQCCARSKRVA